MKQPSSGGKPSVSGGHLLGQQTQFDANHASQGFRHLLRSPLKGDATTMIAGVFTYVLWALGAMAATFVVILLIGVIGEESSAPTSWNQQGLGQQEQINYRRNNNEALKGFIVGNTIGEYLDNRDDDHESNDDIGGDDGGGGDD